MTDRLAERADAVREFNRFHTNVVGLLRGGYLGTSYSLTEARVLFELAHRDATEVVELRRAVDIDAGYLSRILGRFEKAGLVVRERSRSDARRQIIRPTRHGRAEFATLDQRASSEARELLSRLTDDDQRRLVGAMGAIQEVLGDHPRATPFVLRPLGPGDYGWVVWRHGVAYAHEYGWDETFEALVARIVADYVDNHDPRRENAWIAEVDGAPVGCVFCVRADDSTAKLRMLLVEPTARGLGVGSRLVEECIRFARRAGYKRMTLWTNDVLTDARRVYERAGFELAEEEPHHSFGHDLVGQNWSLTL